MRSDMRDVLITRGRTGWRGKRKGRARPLEELPFREGICRDRTRWFDDHLGPLKRFLSSRVGRHWDDVWSEICAQLDRRGLLQEHVFVHLLQMVEVRVDVVDGAVVDRVGRPIQPGRWRTSYYVDPETGRLARAPLHNRPRRRR